MLNSSFRDDDDYYFGDAKDYPPDKDYSNTKFGGLAAVKPEKIVFLEDLNRLFPKAQ